jgi:hypothetical protein
VALTIDSSENVLIGQTTASSGTVGTSLRPDGRNFYCADGNYSAHFNRNSSDGAIAHFAKDDTIVGSIGSVSGVDLFVAGSRGAGQRYLLNNILPCNASGDVVDNTIDFGQSNYRYRDAYLSGGVYLGGTAAANKLDDAEYGVWNPGNYNIVLASTNGNYVKVGRMCTVAFRLVWPTNSNTAQAKISLPFACVSHGSSAHMAGLAIAFTTYTNTPSGGVYSGGTFMEFFKAGSSNLTNADLSGKQINGSVTYVTNS